MTKLLAESNSLNSLANILGLTVGTSSLRERCTLPYGEGTSSLRERCTLPYGEGTIRNNMNWAKGIKITNKDTGKKTTVYLVEKGASIRTEALSSQLGPKALYSKVKL